MKIAVLVKQVPASETTLQLDSDKPWINEADADFQWNESDGYALEAALQLREKSAGDTEVVVISMGP